MKRGREEIIMNTGERIQNARKLRGMTQRELGLEMHYSYRTAAVRIAQDEAGMKKPTNETVEELAKALNVSRKALTGPEGYAVEDIVRFLFELEDQGYEIEIHKRDGEMVVEIRGEMLSKPLKEWKTIQNKYKKELLTMNQYLTWKLCWEVVPDTMTA